MGRRLLHQWRLGRLDRRWSWHGRRNGARHPRRQRQLAKLQLAQIEILTGNADDPAMARLEPIGIEGKNGDQHSMRHYRKHQRFWPRGPQLQFRILVQEHRALIIGLYASRNVGFTAFGKACQTAT